MDLISKFTASPRDFPEKELGALAGQVRERIVAVVAENGGHLASSLGAVDICIALLRVFDPLRDRIVFDVGHQAYAWKILTGRNDSFGTLRRHGGISGFPRMAESPADAFGAGHAGIAISAALGISAASAAPDGRPPAVVAVTGDASIANGISLEALNNIDSAKGPFIILLNDNRMAISRNVGALSRHFGFLLSSRRYNRVKGSIEALGKKLRLHGLSPSYHRLERAVKRLFVRSGFFENLGIRYMGPLDGHNIVRLSHALEIARDYARPIVIHAATHKGRGYAPAEADPAAWHGVGPFDAATGKARTPPARDYSAAFGEALHEAAREDSRVVAITAAMTSGTGLAEFAREFPGRFYDVGICEEHALSFAAGLAAGGARPFAALYSTFAQRAVDSFIHDVCLQNLPVTLCLDRAGSVGADGATHHGLYDIPLLRALPNAVIAQPRDAATMRSLIGCSLAMARPFVLRYPRGKCEQSVPAEAGRPDEAIKPGSAQILKLPAFPSSAPPPGIPPLIWLWALGDMIPIALGAARLLEGRGAARVGVVDPVFIKPLDTALLKAQVAEGAAIATIENGVLPGGFGSAVMEAAPGVPVRRFGWPDALLPHGSPAELLAAAGLTAEAVADALAE